jgi:hypothetical protein
MSHLITENRDGALWVDTAPIIGPAWGDSVSVLDPTLKTVPITG